MRYIDTKIGSLNSIVFSPKGDSLLTIGGQGNAIIWDLEDAKPKASFLLPASGFPWTEYATFAPNGKTIAIANRWSNGMVWLWDTETEAFVHELPDNGLPGQPTFSPDSQRLVVPDWSGKAHLWDVASGKTNSNFRRTPRRSCDCSVLV